jgi:hypothetical protein
MLIQFSVSRRSLHPRQSLLLRNGWGKEILERIVMPWFLVAKGRKGGAGAPRTLSKRATERAFHPLSP